VCLNLIMVR